MSASPPSPAAAVEVDEEAASGAANHAAAEGAEPSENVGSTSSLREMLLASDPDPDLATVESPWDPERGGRNRVYRGLQKMLGASGMPAVVDIVVGALEEISSLEQGSLGGSSEDEEEDSEGTETVDREGNGDPLEATDAAAG